METGYECLIPSTGETMLVRGLTIREELASQKTMFIGTKSILEKTMYMAKVAYECSNLVENQVPFTDFLTNHLDSDLNPILFGIIYNTWGPTITLSDICPVKKEQTTYEINMDNIQASGSANLEHINFELNTVVLPNGVSLVSTPYLALVDSFSLLTYLQKHGLVDLESPSDIVMEKIMMTKKLRNIRAFSTKEGIQTIRPAYTDVAGLVKWYDTLAIMIQEFPSRYLVDIQPKDSDFTLKFAHETKCKECGQNHPISLDCLQRFMELIAP